MQVTSTTIQPFSRPSIEAAIADAIQEAALLNHLIGTGFSVAIATKHRESVVSRVLLGSESDLQRIAKLGGAVEHKWRICGHRLDVSVADDELVIFVSPAPLKKTTPLPAAA